MRAAEPSVGLWMIGACGGVGSTVAVGVEALRRRLVPATGLVTALPAFQGIPLVDPGRIVLGGHEVRAQTMVDAARGWQREAGLYGADMLRACEPALRSIDRNIRTGTLDGATGTVREFADRAPVSPEHSAAATIERLTADIVEFRRRNRLDTVVVINISSSEPVATTTAAHATYPRLSRALARKGGAPLPPSSMYALAAVEAECPFINFTPSSGIAVPAIRQRAAELGVPYMGRDGKTGETLVKSVLAPMFALRNLHVLSWFGQNILGNRDGAVLDDPATRQSKIDTKDGLIAQILGYPTSTRVGIDYVPSLSDWKVAWDHIHFAGFLGTRMSMQFIWQGCDSILAAPLVIDLARLAAFEERWRRGGPMRHLACFFKSPMDVTEQDYGTQWRMLAEHVTSRAADCGIRL